MKLIIHRDTEKIGGSVVELISSSNSRIIIDLGLPLLDDDGSMFNFNKYKSKTIKELIDLNILPDIKGLYKDSEQQTNSEIDGILISHAHKDHYGLFQYVRDDIKFYLTEPTRKLISLTSLFTGTVNRIDNYQYDDFPPAFF